MGAYGKNQVIIARQFEVDAILGFNSDAVEGIFARPNQLKVQ